MRKVPNDIVQCLIRHLELILDNMDVEAVRRSSKLSNAVRLTRINVKRLKKIENEQKKNNNRQTECP